MKKSVVLMGALLAAAALPGLAQAKDHATSASEQSSLEPSPSEWTGSHELLEYMGEISFFGPNMAGLPPLGPDGITMIGRVEGGTAVGPVLNGEILPAGEDWALIRPDGSLVIDVQLLLKTDDGAYIRIHYEGRWKGENETRQAIIKGEAVEPTDYYLRSAPLFETTDPRYEYLNNVIAVGYGRVERGAGATWRIYRVK